LNHNGVGYVAVPDVHLDYAATGEVALIRQGLPYLHQVWSGAHWQVWQVQGGGGLVDGPGRLVSLGPDRFVLAADSPGPTALRVRYTPYWRVTSGSACLSQAPDGWTQVQVLRPGRVAVSAQLLGPKPAACRS
jgi:hypothetical protein